MNADPSVAEQAARLAERAASVALCLDFDGTLSPIVDDPQAARPLHGIVELLEPLAERFAAVALISGRPANYLAEHAAAPGVRYLGLYGLQEIHDGQVQVDPRLKAARPAVVAAHQDLKAHPVVQASGAWLEDKEYAVAVHTRRVADPDRWTGPIDQAAREVADRHGLERWSRASWSGNCARTCGATRATRSAGWSLSRPPGRSSWSVTTWVTWPPSPPWPGSPLRVVRGCGWRCARPRPRPSCWPRPTWSWRDRPGYWTSCIG
jgi:hypothetical protein